MARTTWTDDEVNRMARLVVKFRSLDEHTMVNTIAKIIDRPAASVWTKMGEIAQRAN